MNSIKIRNMAKRRGITSLYHFTPLANLESILLNGLVSRCILDEHQARYIHTDKQRKDGYLNGVSVSIHDINRAMFSQKVRTLRRAWVVLEINASILWTHSCRFCWVNAATTEIVRHSGFIGGPWAFEKMFADKPISSVDHRSVRKVCELPDNLPTMKDAEVLVFDPIEPELIRDVTVFRGIDHAVAVTAMESAGRVLPIAVSSHPMI